MDWIKSPLHRSAVVALLCGDLCIARYAGNFFAKLFIPNRIDHIRDAESLGVEPSRVCIACWHKHRQIVLEDEGHVFFECREYDEPREEFMSAVSNDTKRRIISEGTGNDKLASVFQSSTETDWIAFGRFAARIRYARRLLRQQFEARGQRATNIGYVQRKLQWRRDGKFVCRHGVFFRLPPSDGCACLRPDAGDWTHAVYMPALDMDLKAIVLERFDLGSCTRLGVLQAAARRRGW
jgi:hypothetical protein